MRDARGTQYVVRNTQYAISQRQVLLVVGAEGTHPVPSRTRQLSPPAPMVLGAQAPGRVGHRQENLFLIPPRLKTRPPGLKTAPDEPFQPTNGLTLRPAVSTIMGVTATPGAPPAA